MDPKDLRANVPLSISVSDDSTKYAHNSSTFPANKSKSYHDIGSTSMGKVDATAVRPCAIIGPDRVLPQTSGDVYLKKTPVEPWPCTENAYRQPPDYPNRLSEYAPIRNISPRQTFQENMQRIMVPPTYSSIKNSDDSSSLKNPKLNMPQEVKYCDVPYNMNSMTNELKSVRNSDVPMSSVNPAFGRSVPHYGWPAGVNIRPSRPYGAPEIFQYQEYPSCVGPRPVTVTRPHRIHREETAQVYSERLYQEANIRFKPYPILKEKHQQTRYDYINNYQNNFHPPVTFPPHKYDLQKSLQSHPYPVYPQVPLKYLDRRLHETFIDGYQRSNQQPNFNPQFHNQVIHPSYGPISGNCVQNKSFTDLSGKPMATNKLPHENSNKIYFELEPSRNKGYPVPENVYYNDTNHAQHLRSEIVLPNRSTLNMHSMPQHHIYRRENLPIKHYEYNPHYRNLDQSHNLNYTLPRLPLQYSPNTVAISPSDSNTSNDTTHTLGTTQEDCGYVSQSSTNSVRSLDTVPKDMYRRHDYNMHAIPRNINGSDKVPKNKNNSSNKKNIDVRQFLQMWNESEDEANESNKEIVTQVHPNTFPIPSKTIDNQEQLYVLGLVNVPNEELSKYEHIQKISKLPENIKGYNSLELLNQYEELLETPNNKNNYKVPIPKVYKDHNPVPKRTNDKENNTLPRPVSPLDVEAKISQSVIHKEVGCNFEIKPCSPEMLNVEVATPIQSILGERIIEKVANPLTSNSPILPRNDDSKVHNPDISSIKITSCDIINKQYPVNNYDNIIKNNNYNVQDFESNSGISLASLPRLDNDIELNFPEINQQFIKANQIETDAHLLQKDLNQINLDQITHEKSSYQQSSLSPQFCIGSAPEKEFSKLSKYRKNKKSDVMSKDVSIERNTVTVQRINSVIIKNPDTKLQEETAVSFSTSNKTSCENIDYNYNTEQDPEKVFSSKKPENNDDNQMSFDTAIDFSLNKTETVTSYESLNKCTDKQIYSEDNHIINISSKIDKEIISKEQPAELNLNQINDHEKLQENIINKEPIEHSENQENQNSALIINKSNANLNKYTEGPHFFNDSHNISFSSEIDKEIISKKEHVEGHLKQIRDHETIKENIIDEEPIEHSEVKENQNSPSITYKSYDCLNTYTDEPHLSNDTHNISFSSEIVKNIISNEAPVELPNIIKNKSIEDSEIKEKDNSISITYNMPVKDLKEENNIPIIKNISIISEIEEYANLQKNTTCILGQEESSLLETLTISKSVDIEKTKTDETAIVTNSSQKLNLSFEKELDTSQTLLIEDINLKNNNINQNLDVSDDDDNNKNYNISEVSNEFNEVKEISNGKELLIVGGNDVNMSTPIENTSKETMLSDDVENKIDEKNIPSPIGINKELTKGLGKIEEESKEDNILKLSVNLEVIETQTFIKPSSPDNLSLNSQDEVINKTNDMTDHISDNEVPEAKEYTFNACNPKANKATTESSKLEIHKSNSDNKTFNRVAKNNVLIEHSKCNQDGNLNSKENMLFTSNEEISLGNNVCSSNTEKEIITDNIVDVDIKCNVSKTISSVSTLKKKYLNITKELFSPWFQKLIMFREGICGNVHNSAIETVQEKITKVNTSFETTDKKVNGDLFKQSLDMERNDEQNNLIVLETRTKAVVRNCYDHSSSQEICNYNKKRPTNDLSIFPEDNKKSNIEENHSIPPTTDSVCHIRRNVLKRSLSESALEDYKDDENIEQIESSKRKKRNHNIIHPIISEDLCRIIQTNRRNSISTFYNEDNVFILIDNHLIIEEENDDSDKMYYTEMPHDFENNIPQNDCIIDDKISTNVINEITSVQSDLICEEKPIEESWVEDVACIETVVSEDIIDDIDYEVVSPKKCNLVDDTLGFCDNKYIEKIKNTYNSNMCSNDTEILKTLYMTPQMNVNKTLLDIESHSVKYQEYNKIEDLPSENKDYLDKFEDEILLYNNCEVINEKENINSKDTKIRQSDEVNNRVYDHISCESNEEKEKCSVHSNSYELNRDYIIHSPKKTVSNYSSSSSPEVSSTTPEDKNSNVLLKITNHNGSRISKVTEIGSLDRLSYKLTENKDYQNYNTNFSSSRTLITKAAQKYIPPLKESIRDLKIKLTLPQHRLRTLEQLKISKVEPKIEDNVTKYTNQNKKKQIPKKVKPKFEDVLKSIDEIQFQKHRDKIKKGKNGIPKVVIKKNENGAHFASCKTANDNETYNPDLTGRKWQPWVFLEKNNFIDKMAIKNKVKAVYCHRKNNYVLAEKFRKYKSIYNANFVISQPSSNNSARGTLKYTIRLKHK